MDPQPCDCLQNEANTDFSLPAHTSCEQHQVLDQFCLSATACVAIALEISKFQMLSIYVTFVPSQT